MTFRIIAVGILKSCPERDLFDEYKKRMRAAIDIIEIDPRKFQGKEKEAQQIFGHINLGDHIIALDEKGRDFSTIDLQTHLQKVDNNVTFVIGGADGLDESIKKRANQTICFGRLTWPHLLVRVMLIEQLYRIQQLGINHPYHRA